MEAGSEPPPTESGAAGVLVLVGPSSTLEDTIEFAVDRAASTEDLGDVHLVCTVPRRRSSVPESTRRLLDRAESTANARTDDSTAVHTAVLGVDRYLADPTDHADVLETYAADRGIDRVVVDPSYAVDATAPSLQPIDSALAAAGLHVERPPATPGIERPCGAEIVRAGVVFLLTYGFYLLLGDPTSAFDLATGAGAALLAGVLLRNVTFETTPNPHAAPRFVLRGALFVPYLLWEIAKANVQFASVVLQPSLPIDPRLDRVDADVDDGVAVTALANSLTLTPGTLTVDADGNELLVHSLDGPTRDDFLSGNRERAVRFVFYGRDGTDTPGPLERGDAVPIAGPGSDPDGAGDTTGVNAETEEVARS